MTDADLYDVERELSHLLSDMGTYGLQVPDIAERLSKTRNNLRKKLRGRGYTHF